MTFMKIRGIKKSFNESQIINNAEFDIKHGSRIGLVGNNGAGKTTLANIIYGSVLPDAGMIETFNGSVNIGYLKQSTEYSVLEFEDALTLAEKGLFTLSSKLGLSKTIDWGDTPWENLSGGEKLKLSLASVWASRPELLILDEPTNHLDLQGVAWLINELKAFNGAVIIISHDRYFLDQTVTEIVEIEAGETKLFNGNYSLYRLEKQRLYEIQLHQYETQEKYKQQIERQIANLKNWSEKAHRDSTKQGSNSERRQIGYKEYHRMKAKKMDIQIKSKTKRLNQELEKNEVKQPKQETKVSFQFKASQKRGKRIIEAQNLGKYFGNRCLFDNSHFYMNHGERMAILGVNGSGKTTLINMLLGNDKGTTGSLWMSDSLRIGYLSQDVSDLPPTKNALEYTGLTDLTSLRKARTIFANIGMAEEKLTIPIDNLSLGERTRIKLVMMLLNDLDLLILDEPTNHLDLASRESLEKTLMEFHGSMLIVSHDVYFLEKISNKLLVISDCKIIRKEEGMKELNNPKTSFLSNIEKDEQLMLLQNEITSLIGKLSFMSKNDKEYEQIDTELAKLIKAKKELE
ncbi:ABC-F type ribosomal protection protein [Mesobacillus subterraneus]|uniref:ribosomal protection-like ABC-F family protein n=1 Tax=Mesobacillus subterraneus TaxID=285983 RepID=UPI00203ABA4B|nr:ABC-F type ribosomal protection protein [Mesobacillus subterraneus]MCM3664269.1 ABC-F type ribosomal protection protein [Mesobacillus subterraneus]MCM3682296.1 ABC-F type ribosomal protection protein [Mesobacillus subterraneus]